MCQRFNGKTWYARGKQGENRSVGRVEVDEDTERFCKKMLEVSELDASDKGGIVPRVIIDNGL